uniref:Uncharacterized protein n=1 Tax=Arundo donax TaxID=35708 RepID=A0A0A8ZWP6_ARUDO
MWGGTHRGEELTGLGDALGVRLHGVVSGELAAIDALGVEVAGEFGLREPWRTASSAHHSTSGVASSWWPASRTAASLPVALIEDRI